MQNYKKSFFYSFFIHLFILCLVVLLALLIHKQYKKKEIFIAVRLFRVSKSVHKLHVKNISKHKFIKHISMHKKIIYKPHKSKHKFIKHISMHKKIIYKPHKTKHINKHKRVVRHSHKIKPVLKHIRATGQILQKRTVIKPKGIQKHILVKPRTESAIKKKNIKQKMIKTNRVYRKSIINPVIAQRIKHNYFDYLYEMINSHKVYPMIARKLEQTGVVKVGFLLLNDGEILHVKIVKSSGFIFLDNAAKEILVQLHKIKPIPKVLSRKPLQIVVPIDYTLY